MFYFIIHLSVYRVISQLNKLKTEKVGYHLVCHHMMSIYMLTVFPYISVFYSNKCLFMSLKDNHIYSITHNNYLFKCTNWQSMNTFFVNFLPFYKRLEEKGKKRRIKGKTVVQWIDLRYRTNRMFSQNMQLLLSYKHHCKQAPVTSAIINRCLNWYFCMLDSILL